MKRLRFRKSNFAIAAISLLCIAGCVSPPPAARAAAEWRTNASAAPAAATAAEGRNITPDAPPSSATVTEYFGTESEAALPGGARKGRLAKGSKRIEMNFQDADVRSVIDAVLGDMLKLNYSIAPQVQGKITLRTGRPILHDSVLPALEAALMSVSAAIIAQDGAFQVVPLENAAQRVRRAQRIDSSQQQAPGYAIEIIPLRYVSAREIQRILESIAPKGSVLQADDTHNHLVIAGTSHDRAAIMQTIDGFDMDWLQGMSFALYKVEQTEPEQLISELRQIFLPPLELVTTRVRLVPIARMQSILGISKHRADLEMLESWIRKLDGASKSGDRKLYIYNVQNGSAKDIAKSLQLVISGEILGGRDAREPVSSGSDKPQPGGSQIPAVQPAAQLPSGGNQSRIVANDENNSLIIFATEKEYRTMRDALRQLDVMPRQVMIEAILAEVTLGDNLRYGVQWTFNSSANTMTLSAADSGGVNSQFPGFSYIYSGAANARLVLNALRSRTEVKILSSPKLTVLNNQKAELQVGDQIPVLTQVSQGTASPGAPIVTSIQMRDTGVILEVTPRISDNGNVVLEVTQEVSDVTTNTTSGIDSPTIQRRRLRSVVATRDGATVALGGLIREARNAGKTGVPLLGDLPVVGNLFRNNTTDGRRTELIVLLVPHVMRDHAGSQAVVDALIDSMSSVADFANNAKPLQPGSRQ